MQAPVKANASPIESLRGGIAVITGGASGIGLAVAHAALQRGLHVAVGDVEAAALEPAVAELRAAAPDGLQVEGFRCDVTDTASTDAFAASVHGAFDGAPVSLLHANAGVGAGPTILDSTPDDWLFTFRVNVYGVVNTLRSFVPTMVERGAPAAVVCTSSIAGIMGQSGGAYGASKHACTVLAEGVFAEVAPTAPHLSFHTLHPQIVDTKIDESQRNRPEDLSDLSATDFLDLGGIGDKLFHERGMPPSGTAAHLFAGVGRGDFYIFSENPGDEGWTRKAVMARMSSLVSRGVPIGSPPMNMAAGLMPQEVRSAAPVSANCNDAEALQVGPSF